jgi:iron complex transport system substrate-binding protein
MRIRPLLFLLATFSTPAAAGPVELRDDLQRIVTLPGPAQRVVSLAPSITESLFAVGAGDRVAGVTDYCNHPESARTKPRVGGMLSPNLEAIAALNPDLILLSMEGNQREDFGALTRLGVPVFVTNPRDLKGIAKSLRDIGALTGRTEQADQAAGELLRRSDSLAGAVESLPRVRTLLVVSVQPLVVVGKGTFLQELLERAGAENLAETAPTTYPAYSREAVVAGDPEALLFLTDVLPPSADLTALFPEWSGLGCVRNGRIHRLDPDILSRPGPRAAEALRLLVTALHPAHP